MDPTLFNVEGDEEFVSSNMNKMFDYLKDKKTFCIDIETTEGYGKYPNEGLDPYTSKIVMIQVGDAFNQFIIDTRKYVDITLLKELLEDDNYTKVGHNLKFEYKHLKHTYAIELQGIYDTMIVDQILYNGVYGRRYSLAALAKVYLNKELNKGVRGKFLKIGSRPFTYNQLKYGADDIITPLEIKDHQKERIKKYDLSRCIRLEMDFIPVLGDIELVGMHFNKAKWIDLYDMNMGSAILLRRSLNTFMIDHRNLYFKKNPEFYSDQLDMFNPDPYVSMVNWDSPKQVTEVFRVLNICPEVKSKHTGKISYSVEANELKNLLEQRKKYLSTKKIELINAYLGYKVITKKCTTYGLDFIDKYVNPITGRIHSDYRQILSTGRISSSNPNLQNIPAEAAYRSCFDSPDNYKIVNADYSGQEQIILANKSKAPNILKFYEEGLGDMHSFVASKIYKKPFENYIDAIKASKTGIGLTKYREERIKERQTAKGAGFAINYGGNGYTISKNLNISRELGDEIYKEYFKAFPGLNNYFKYVKKKSLKDGYILIDHLTKRKYFFRAPTNFKETAAVERAALNFPVQGEAGSITKLAAIIFRKEVRRRGFNFVFITNLVHDEINVECPSNVAAYVAKILEDSMKQAGKYWCKTVPLTAKAVISDYWTH